MTNDCLSYGFIFFLSNLLSDLSKCGTHVIKEFLKTARAVEREPWDMRKAAAYLRNLVKNNQDEKIYDPVDFSFINRPDRSTDVFKGPAVDLSSIGYEFAPAPPRPITITAASNAELNKRRRLSVATGVVSQASVSAPLGALASLVAAEEPLIVAVSAEAAAPAAKAGPLRKRLRASFMHPVALTPPVEPLRPWSPGDIAGPLDTSDQEELPPDVEEVEEQELPPPVEDDLRAAEHVAVPPARAGDGADVPGAGALAGAFATPTGTVVVPVESDVAAHAEVLENVAAHPARVEEGAVVPPPGAADGAIVPGERALSGASAVPTGEVVAPPGAADGVVVPGEGGLAGVQMPTLGVVAPPGAAGHANVPREEALVGALAAPTGGVVAPASLAGAAALRAAAAPASAFEKRLGCGKCRGVPKGCDKCRQWEPSINAFIRKPGFRGKIPGTYD